MKSISPENYTVRPFIVHKTQAVAYTFLSESNTSPFSIDIAVQPPRPWAFYSGSDFINTGSNFFAGPLYAATKQLFYNTGSTISGTISAVSGTIIGNVIYPIGSSLVYPSGNIIYVLSISRIAYGEGINPGTFAMTAPLSTASLYDDTNGNIVSTIASGGFVGNIFYGAGIVVLQQSTGSFTSSIISHNGVYLNTGSIVNISFDATRTIYEHQATCTINEGEFNYSTNPSILFGQISGSGSVLSQYYSGSLKPYMTSVGCYNDAGELLAVAKFPSPIKRAVNSQQTVVVRFDI
jgi:hypothetical protein